MPLSRAPAVDNSVCDGRLTLATATPVTTSDQSAKSTVFWTPWKGNRVSLYSSTGWILRSFSELSVAVPSTIFRPFDIFVYDNAGTLALETVNWNQSTAALTNATAAAPCVITSTAHGLSNGNMVGIGGIVGTVGTNTNNGVNGKLWQVANVTADTFELEGSDTSGLAYTSGGTWYRITNTRATALALQDGVQVKTGETGKRYLGTSCTHVTSGQTQDTAASRLLWNMYNRVDRPTLKREGTSSWSYNTSTYRAANNNTTNRFELMVGLAEGFATALVQGAFLLDAAGDGFCAIGKNTCITPNLNLLGTHGRVAANDYANVFATAFTPAFAGLQYYQFIEKGNGSGTQTFYGGNEMGISGNFFA